MCHIKNVVDPGCHTPPPGCRCNIRMNPKSRKNCSNSKMHFSEVNKYCYNKDVFENHENNISRRGLTNCKCCIVSRLKLVFLRAGRSVQVEPNPHHFRLYDGHCFEPDHTKR